MNKAFKKYNGKKWRECGFKPANVAFMDFVSWLYWQPEWYIKYVLGRKRAKLFIRNKLCVNDFVKGARK